MRKEQKKDGTLCRPGCAELLDDELVDGVQEFLCIIGMRMQLDGLGKIQAEDAHNGLSVDGISAGHQIYVKIETHYDVYEFLYVVDRLQGNGYCCHKNTSHMLLYFCGDAFPPLVPMIPPSPIIVKGFAFDS